MKKLSETLTGTQIKTKTVPFDIYVPALKVDTINVEVINENGNEIITTSSQDRIDELQRRYIREALHFFRTKCLYK